MCQGALIPLIFPPAGERISGTGKCAPWDSNPQPTPYQGMPRGTDYQSAVPASEVNEVSKTYDDESDAIGVLFGALAAKSFDLALICKRWKQLPEPVKTGIMAMVLVLGPIFEADLLPEQFAYRPNRSAHDAVLRVMRLLETGCREVVDADLSGYFDSIHHAELMKSVARRTSDRHVLRLIKMWLELPVEETDKRVDESVGRVGTGMRGEVRRKARRSPRCWPTSICVWCHGLGRCLASEFGVVLLL